LPSLFEKSEIERALRYALTGRTVVASMDFPDPRSVMRFLLCQGTNIALMTSALAGILVQKEIRVLCPECKERIQGPSLASSASRVLDSAVAHFRPVGCDRCRFTGFSSRETILDFWAMDSELKRVLHGSEPLVRLDDIGGTVLEDNCLDRLRRGDAVLEDVLSVCEI